MTKYLVIICDTEDYSIKTAKVTDNLDVAKSYADGFNYAQGYSEAKCFADVVVFTD